MTSPGHSRPPSAPSTAARSPHRDALLTQQVDNNLDGSGAQEDPLNTSHDTTLSIFQDPINWEEEILKHTRARRQKQEMTISSLQVQLQRLQAALARESKRRVAAIAAVEEKCHHQLASLEETLVARIDEHHEHTLHNLSLLESRIVDLEARWERQVGDLESHIDSTAKQLASQLEELQVTVEQETNAARDRYESQCEQVQRMSDQYDKLWKQERQERMSSVHALTDRINSQDDVAQQHVDRLQAQIGQELQLLHDELQLEAQEREQGDDEIAEALNRYMTQIQKSLHYI